MSTHAPLLLKPVRKPPPRAVQQRRVEQATRPDDKRHTLLADALNASDAIQRLTGIQTRANAPRVPQRAGSESATQARESQKVVQGRFFVAPNPVGTLSTNANRNFLATVQYLSELGQNVVPDLLVNVTNINTGGTNPADTTYNGTDTINVRLQNWYLELASVGELMGMLTHELGVHSLADAEMTGMQKTAETNTNNLGQQVNIGTTNFQIQGEQNNDARSMDHVNAVKLQAVNTLRARGQRYLDTFLRMGDAIETDNAINAGEKTRRQRDLQDTFLFDIGRIVATDDGGAVRGLAGVPGAVAMATPAIAEVMNWYRTTFLVPQYGAHAWLNQPALQQAWNAPKVALMLVDKLVDYGAARIKGASTGTKLMLGAAGVGAVAAGVALAPMTTLALGVGGLAYGAYRWFKG